MKKLFLVINLNIFKRENDHMAESHLRKKINEFQITELTRDERYSK